MLNNNRKVFIIIHDLIASGLAWLLAWLARFNFSFPFHHNTYSEWEACLLTLPFIIIVQGIDEFMREAEGN